MRFGIVSPATPDLIAHCQAAEELGFESAWFFDSHMVYADVYVIMALCAQRTRPTQRVTGTAVEPSRRPAITAHSVATSNLLCPGRVVLGVGTGNSGWRTMGLAAMDVRACRVYVQTVKGLLHGETVVYREGDVVR